MRASMADSGNFLQRNSTMKATGLSGFSIRRLSTMATKMALIPYHTGGV